MTKYILLKDCTEIADRNSDVAKMPPTNDNQLDKHEIQNVIDLHYNIIDIIEYRLQNQT